MRRKNGRMTKNIPQSEGDLPQVLSYKILARSGHSGCPQSSFGTLSEFRHFLTRFRSQTGSTRSTRALYRSEKRRSGSEIDEKISSRDSRDNFLPNKLLSIPNGQLVVENESFPYRRIFFFRRSAGVGPGPLNPPRFQESSWISRLFV